MLEQQVEMNGQLVRRVVKLTPNPPENLTVEFLEGPVTGKMVNTYTEVPGGTKVVTECDVKSQMMDDKQLEAATKKNLEDVFNEDLRYLNTRMK